MNLGQFEVNVISGGRLRLDGGAMFGVVPKPLWQKVAPTDDQNRIQMDTNLLFIQAAGKRVLVDTGLGMDLSEKERLHCCYEGPDVVTALGGLEVQPAEVDLVIFTHLHWDHAAGATTKQGDQMVPTFPNATYCVQRQEYLDALDDFGTGKGGYRREHFVPLEQRGQLQLLEGDAEVLPGVRVQVTGGHTRGHQVIHLESEGQRALYFADTMPTPAHLRPAWNMAFDLFPLDTVRVKLALANQAADENWICFFDHDPTVRAGRVVRGESGRLSVAPLTR